MKCYQIIKWLMTILAVLLLPAMYLVPVLAELRGLFFWMLYGVYLLVVLFVWASLARETGMRAGTSNRRRTTGS